MPSIEVASSSDIEENRPFATRAEGVRLLLTRVEGKVHAVENKCPHLGLSMTRGEVAGSVIRCPWHGSTFDVCSGKNLNWIESVAGFKAPQWSRSLIAFGKQPAPLRTFAAREDAGHVFVDL